MPDVLSIWTVYENHDERPGTFVAWRFEVRPGEPEPVRTADRVYGNSLDVIRGYMEMRGLTCMPRQEGDAMYIVESWI